MNAITVSDRRVPPLQKTAVYWTGPTGQSIVTACRFGGTLEQPFISGEITRKIGCIPE
jgi:hypothetical protein